TTVEPDLVLTGGIALPDVGKVDKAQIDGPLHFDHAVPSQEYPRNMGLDQLDLRGMPGVGITLHEVLYELGKSHRSLSPIPLSSRLRHSAAEYRQRQTELHESECDEHWLQPADITDGGELDN